MAKNVWWMSLTQDKLHFLAWSVRGVIYYLINVLMNFPIILQPWHFCKNWIYVGISISNVCETARKIIKFLLLWPLTRIWIICICAVLLKLWIFKSGKFFLAHLVFSNFFTTYIHSLQKVAYEFAHGVDGYF